MKSKMITSLYILSKSAALKSPRIPCHLERLHYKGAGQGPMISHRWMLKVHLITQHLRYWKVCQAKKKGMCRKAVTLLTRVKRMIKWNTIGMKMVKVVIKIIRVMLTLHTVSIRNITRTTSDQFNLTGGQKVVKGMILNRIRMITKNKMIISPIKKLILNRVLKKRKIIKLYHLLVLKSQKQKVY